ncbi:MAG: NIPSNAP family protein [Bryobacterales bacterium]|nr:NIPSNAP family protein [Bryobacterales bacterium]
MPHHGYSVSASVEANDRTMDRRSFVGMLGGLSLAAGQRPEGEERKTRLYLLELFYLKHGTQLGRLHNYLSQAVLPALNQVHAGPKIVLEALVAPHMPQVAMLLGFQSVAEMWQVRAKLQEDEALKKAFETWQEGPEPPFEQQHNILLEAAAYSPEVVPLDPPPKTPRIFELRVYHSPTWRQLKALHERFEGPEIKIFHRVGVHPILYTSTVIGPNMPNLTYLIPFEDLAAREKAWSAFAADPEWIKVRQESIERHGQIASVIQIALYRAAPYSPVR